MNVLYIHTHDTGRFISPYGYQIPTPNLMSLAQEGVIFRQAFSAAPTCSPSRTALLSGMTPHSNGMLGLAHRGFQMNDYGQHIVQWLNQNSYETVLCGEQHESESPAGVGYQILLTPQSTAEQPDMVEYDLQNAQAVARYLAEERTRPFFLSFGLNNTHRVFPASAPEINPNYVIPPPPLPDVPEVRADMAAYMTSAAVVDRCVGIVLDALRASNLESDTLVIFTTDHGIAFPKMKCNLLDTGIGVSLLMKCPNNQAQGEAIDTLVSHLDIFPTICDFAGISKPPWLQGSSLKPLLDKQTDHVRDEIFAEVTFHAAYEPMRCIRTKRYKLIRLYETDHIPANIDDSPTKLFLLEHGLLERTKPSEQLYDLYLDPLEQINLAGDDRYAEIYQDLSTRLNNWMRETNDPLLQGKVPKPAGAIVNKKTCLHAEMQDFE